MYDEILNIKSGVMQVPMFILYSNKKFKNHNNSC